MQYSTFGPSPRLREAGRRPRHPRGCADRAEGWRACAHLNDSSALAPHAGDCRVFFYCAEGARPACRRCPAGLHFNPQLQVCDWPANVECSTRPPRPSRPPRDGYTTFSPTTPEAEASVSVTDSPSSPPPEPSTEPSSSEAPSYYYDTTRSPEYFSTTSNSWWGWGWGRR